MEEKKIKAYKGFDKNLCCIGFQYEIGKEYEQKGEIKCCENGFHACINPFDVLNYYYANSECRYCEVEQSGIIKTDENSSKLASSKIKIKKEIGLIGLLKKGIKWIKENINPISIINEIEKEKTSLTNNSTLISSNSNYSKIGSYYNNVKIGSSGDGSKISTSGYATKIGAIGYCTYIGSSGDFTQIGSNGNYSRISSSGHYTEINLNGTVARVSSSGDYTKIISSDPSTLISSSGDYTKICSIHNFAKIGSSGNNTLIYSSGDFAKISVSGNSTVISTNGNYDKISSSGDYINIDSTGKYSVICCAGKESMAKAKIDSWITLSEWKYSKDKKYDVPICVKTEYVDGERIKADTWYKLIDGEFREQ